MLVTILLGTVAAAVVKLFTNEHRGKVNRYKRRASDIWGIIAVVLILLWVLSHGG